MTADFTTGVHGQRIMTALSVDPLRFKFQVSTGDRGRAQVIGTSDAEFSRTTTAILIGDRDDLSMIEVSVLTGPLRYVRHTTVGLAVMTAVAKLASDEAFAWLSPLLEAGDALAPGQMRTHDAERLRLVLRSAYVGEYVQVAFIVTPNRKFQG